MKVKALLALAGVLVLLLVVCAYTVDETEQVVVTRFDKVQKGKDIFLVGIHDKLSVDLGKQFLQ